MSVDKHIRVETHVARVNQIVMSHAATGYVPVRLVTRLLYIKTTPLESIDSDKHQNPLGTCVQ